MGTGTPAGGLIVDFGGVLTTSIGACFEAFCERERIDPRLLERILGSAYGVGTDPDELVAMMETGRIDRAEFERRLARQLSEGLDHPIAEEGLLSRMLADLRVDLPMVEAVRDFHRAGIPTAMLSNSWGVEQYPRELLRELFDDVVISGEIGIRKPHPDVFLLAAERLDLPPGRCVFVDDTEGNVQAAERVGMQGVVHVRTDETIRRLEVLLGIRVEPPSESQVGSIGS